MNDDKKSKSMLLKLMWLDFIFGVIGIIIARNITPNNISDLILSRTGGNNFTVDINYYTSVSYTHLTLPTSDLV